MNIRRNKMALSTLLKLQLIYCIFGIGYNIVSYYLLMSGGRPLSSNSPIIGGLAMFAYGFCLISAQKGFYKIYRQTFRYLRTATRGICFFLGVADCDRQQSLWIFIKLCGCGKQV